MPNAVGDDAIKYQCLSCFAEIVFETCLDCGFKQSVPARWNTAYTCGKCGVRCELPRRRLYAITPDGLRDHLAATGGAIEV